jgi:hypothetical protein
MSIMAMLMPKRSMTRSDLAAHPLHAGATAHPLPVSALTKPDIYIFISRLY